MKKIFAILLLVILTFNFSGCNSEPTSDEELVEIYKQLALKDFAIQKVLADEDLPINQMQAIYIEPALSEYIESLELMRANNIKRIYNKTDFTNVIVKQNDGNQALVKVKAEYKGYEYSIMTPVKNLGPFAFDYFAEVTLKKVKGKWFISNIRPDSPK